MVSTKLTMAKTLILRVQFFGLSLEKNDAFVGLAGTVVLLKSRLYELLDAELDEAASSKGPDGSRWCWYRFCWPGSPAVTPSWESMFFEGIVKCVLNWNECTSECQSPSLVKK